MKNRPDDIEKLGEKIAKLRQKESIARQDRNPTEMERAARIGFRIGVELFAAVFVGAGIGYLADDLFGTKPWLIVVFLFLGGAAGILNVYRLAKSEDNRK